MAKAEAARAEAEVQFFLAVKAEERFRELFEPLDPEGRRWTDDRVEDELHHVAHLHHDLHQRLSESHALRLPLFSGPQEPDTDFFTLPAAGAHA